MCLAVEPIALYSKFCCCLSEDQVGGEVGPEIGQVIRMDYARC